MHPYDAFAPLLLFPVADEVSRRAEANEAAGFPNNRGAHSYGAAWLSFWDVAILKFLMPRRTIEFMHPCGHPIPVLVCCNHYELWRERLSQYATVSTEIKYSCVTSRCLLLVNGRVEEVSR